ncbi:MAG: MFS transporter [Sphingomonadaceae bacterium]|nr:MFS transporter [Sphingomonadaceae bacterium]
MTVGKGEWRSGWSIVLGCSIGMGTCFAVFNTLSSLFLKGMQQDLGWSRGDISTGLSLILIGGLSAPLVGMAIDRIGMRKVALSCIFALGIIYAGLAMMPAEQMWFYALMLLFGIFGMGTSGVAFTRVINSWFAASRGLALGVMLTGISIAGMLLPPVLSGVIESYTWRGGFWLMSGVVLLTALPATFFLVHERREWEREHGQLQGSFSGPDASASPHGDGLDWRAIWRTRQFWLMIICFVACNIPGTGILSQLQPLLIDKGIAAATAAGMLSIYAAAVMFGHVATGYLMDRYKPTVVACLYTMVPAFGAAALLSEHLRWELAVFAVITLGLAQGAEIDLCAYFCARYFGMRTYSSVFGVMVMTVNLGGALGVNFFGQIFDRSGTYDLALMASVMLVPLGALCLLGLGPFPTAFKSDRQPNPA